MTNLLAVGINHKTAPISLRERLAFVPTQMPEPLHDFIQSTQVCEAALLSTCNRIEFYCAAKNPPSVLDWLAQRHDMNVSELAPHIYHYEDDAAVRHMLRVASGLDSMVLGEPQILGQMKSAFELAVSAGTVGPQLQRLFQYIFATTKSIRHKTRVGHQPVTMAYAAIKLAKHIFSNMRTCPILTIGAGATIEMMLRHLQKYEIQNILIANRNLLRAQNLAALYGAKAIGLDTISQYIAKVDIIIAATASPLPLIGKGLIESALKARKHRPLLIIDFAVPRNIEPEVSHLTDVYLYTLDDLQKIIEENQKDRLVAAEQAENIINIHANNFMRWLNSLVGTGTIKDFREKLGRIRDDELAKAKQSLKKGDCVEQVLDHLAHGLTNKILHTPSVAIRKASYNDKLELLACVRNLFALEDA